MHGILRSLIQGYVNPDMHPGAPILLHGVYSWHSGKGVDEGNIWEIISIWKLLLRFIKIGSYIGKKWRI